MAKKYDSLSHTKYYTRYHIVFIPKYRRKVIYNKLRKDIAEYFKRLCTYKGGRNHRRTYDAKSCAYAGNDTTENVSVFIYGVFKRKSVIPLRKHETRQELIQFCFSLVFEYTNANLMVYRSDLIILIEI